MGQNDGAGVLGAGLGQVDAVAQALSLALAMLGLAGGLDLIGAGKLAGGRGVLLGLGCLLAFIHVGQVAFSRGMVLRRLVLGIEEAPAQNSDGYDPNDRPKCLTFHCVPPEIVGSIIPKIPS